MAPISSNGSGSITGISAGGLPDDSIIAADIAAGAVTTAKVADANITAAKLDGAQSGSAPIYGARAWVSFDGSSTVAIRASGNVSSITDNGTGDYTVNFTTAMQDANYCATASASASPSQSALTEFGDRVITAASIRLATRNFASYRIDPFEVYVAIFR